MEERKAMSEDLGWKTGFEAVFAYQTRGFVETAVVHSMNEKLSFADFLKYTIYEVNLSRSQSNLSCFFFIVKSVLNICKPVKKNSQLSFCNK